MIKVLLRSNSFIRFFYYKKKVILILENAIKDNSTFLLFNNRTKFIKLSFFKILKYLTFGIINETNTLK